MFATMVPAQADTAYKTFTQDEGIAALEAGDAAGYKVIPRKELEEVRGEFIPALLIYAAMNAPSLTVLMSTMIAYHFPAMLIRDAWKATHK
jgi:hypothetical protein